MQIAVVKEHEARQLAERSLAEAHAVVVPSSAAAELDIQVHLHLKFRSDMCSLCQVDFIWQACAPLEVAHRLSLLYLISVQRCCHAVAPRAGRLT